jgi:nucleotide-binding universal stress UspA family protein
MDRYAQDNNNKASVKFSKILAAVDGSEESFRAAKYAVELAKMHNAQLIALTVNPFPVLYSIDKSLSERSKEQSQEESKMFFDRIATYGADIAGKQGGIQLRSDLIDSPVPVERAIVDYAEKENVDLIVVGSTGKTGWKKVLLGSVASGVTKYSTCPVLVVK